MSELREECYKCLNNQSCPSGADYGSIICMTKRKFKMPRNNEEDSVYATKFAVMQQQIDEKDKRIKELEAKLEFKKWGDLDNTQFEEYMSQFIPKQKVKDKIEEYKKQKDKYESETQEIFANNYYKRKTLELTHRISGLEELLEEK